MSEREPRVPNFEEASSVPEKQPSEKEIAWQQTKVEVDQITDGLGLGIDEGIKDAIIACQVHGLHTYGSCEGHLSEHGLPYPWIDVAAPAPEGWQESLQKKKVWESENLKQREKMASLLEEFYGQRQTSPDARLIFVDRGIYGAFRLQSEGGEALEEVPKDEQAKHVEKFNLYQQEMNELTEFLKQRFFKEL